MAPLFVTLAEDLSTQTVGEDLFFVGSFSMLGPKTGINLSEDLFFWWLSNLELENGLILSGKFFILVFVTLKFSKFPAPPPFENPGFTTGPWLLASIGNSYDIAIGHTCDW